MLLRNLPARSALLAAAIVVPSTLTCVQGHPEAGARTASADLTVAGTSGFQGGSPPSDPRSPRLSPGEQESQSLDLDQIGYDSGSPEAPVRVLELSDFGCGYCRRFHQETFPALLDLYVETGLVQWKFVPFVLGLFPNGLEASIAGECGGEQDRFFPMQRRLFSDQAGWKNSHDPFVFFAQIAAEEGLDVDRFNQCVEGGWRESRVRANIQLARELGARGTPTFVIDGIAISGALPLETFRNILDTALTRKGATPPERG